MGNLYLTGIAATILSVAVIMPTHAAGPDFVPQGHIYTEDSSSLPANRSRQAEIEARADEFEAERYQNQLNIRRNIEYLKLNRFDFGNPNNTLDNW